MALLYGRAGRLTTENAGFRPGQMKAKPLGLKVYEQDWICLTSMKMNATQDNVVLARQWMLAMDRAAVAAGMTIQLCMQFSRHVLQSLEMTAVTNARASTDYHASPDPTCKYGSPNPTCTQYNVFLTGLIYCPRRPGAIKRPLRFPIKINFVWGFCMGAQGA